MTTTQVRRILVAAATLATIHAAPAAAQQDVMRDAFGFHGSALDVLIESEAPGRVRIMRGQRSRIEVAGRAPNGFTSAALGGHGVRRLTLTALGGDRVDFIVVVPEDVRVRVHRPGADGSDLFGALSRTATYAWEEPQVRPAFETLRPTAPLATTPNALDIRGAHRLDRLTLRIGGTRDFTLSPRLRVTTSGGTGVIDARNGDDIDISVPADAPFTLSLDGVDAVIVERGDVRILCESVLSQTLPDGSRWLTLTPVPNAGCGNAPSQPGPPRASPARRT